MIATRWWWIRHAPVISPPGRIYGQSDVPADLSDTDAFAALARLLPEAAVWVTSHLSRTRATAAALARAAAAAGGACPPEPLVEPALVEQNFGAWQGRTYAEIGAFGHQGAGIESHRLWLAPAQFAPPGGESFVEVMARVAGAVERLAEAHAGRDIVAVAHGGTIRAALAHALELAPEAALAFSIETLSLTRIDRFEEPGGGHGWRVGHVNLGPK